MSFFSAIGGAIGTLFGPVGTVIGAGLGGALDGKKTQKTLEKQVAENNRVATIAAENTNAQMENNSRPVETVTTNEADFDSTIRDAEKAGINPLTALRIAGANSRVTSTTTQVGRTRYVAPLLSSMPSRKFTDVIGDAYKGYQSFQRGQINRQKEDLEMQYLKNQVANSNPNLVNNNTINSADILDPVTKYTNGKLNSSNSNAIYDVVQTPVTLDFVQSEKGIVSAEQKSMLYVYVDPWGNKWKLPAEELELSNLFVGGAVVTTAGASKYMRDAGNFIQNLGTKYRDNRYNTEVNLLQKLQNQMIIKNSPLGIRGLTSGIRKTQDEINGFVRSAY